MDQVLFEPGEVAVVTLNRPDRLNAMSWPLIERLHAVLDEIASDDAIRCVLLTGAGRGFCSGTDLKDPTRMAGLDSSGRYALQRRVGSLTSHMRQIPQPIVAAVNGVAAGGGLSIAAAADVRVCAPQASFIASFINIGLTAGDLGLSWFLPRIVGMSEASRIMLTGATVTSGEALRIGLVSQVSDDPVGAARDIASQVAQRPAFAVRLTRELLNLSLAGSSLEQMSALEDRQQVLAMYSGGFEDAIRAFGRRDRGGDGE